MFTNVKGGAAFDRPVPLCWCVRYICCMLVIWLFHYVFDNQCVQFDDVELISYHIDDVFGFVGYVCYISSHVRLVFKQIICLTQIGCVRCPNLVREVTNQQLLQMPLPNKLMCVGGAPHCWAPNYGVTLPRQAGWPSRPSGSFQDPYHRRCPSKYFRMLVRIVHTIFTCHTCCSTLANC